MPSQVWISMSLEASGFKLGFMWSRDVVCVVYTPFAVALDINLCADLNPSNTMLPLFLKVLIPNFTGKHTANARLIPSWCPQSSRVEIDWLDRLCLWYTSIIAVLVFSFLCFAMSCLGELWPFKDGTKSSMWRAEVKIADTPPQILSC